jgi:hypothetical protein
VSGGAVGAAHYLYGTFIGESTKHIHKKSVESSLGMVTYALAYRDFWRVMSGGVFFPRSDRGTLIEEFWARVAAGTVTPEKGNVEKAATAEAGRLRFEKLSECVRAGRLPGFIFGTTAMESGRRIMITPIEFPDDCAYGERRARACTLNEYLDPDAKLRLDIDLWTAARLSATFPWISPPARAMEMNSFQQISKKTFRHHMLDGGYYDNFGIAAALDWLEQVLRERLDGKLLQFKRVLVLQLRSSPQKPPTDRRASSGIKAELLGPVVGVLGMRGGSQVERNRIELNRFIEHWKSKLVSRDVDLKSVILHGDKTIPTTWHLSGDQKAILEGAWESPQNRESRREAYRFLSGEMND